MKALIASIVCLVVGLAVGFYAGYRDYHKHIADEAVQQLVASTESSDRLEAARGVRAIELIQSGDTRQAIQMFSIPVGDFYSEYAHLSHNDEKTKNLLAKIEQVASTNAAVASAIHGKSQ
jgi:hypothetical protein